MSPAARANFLGILAILMWSTLIGMVRSISEAFGVAGGTALMFSIGAVVLLVKNGVPKIRQMPKPYLLGCGLTFVTYEIFLSQSIGLSVSSQQTLEVGMLNYLWPCAIVVLSIWINRQNLRWWVWPGILLAITGIFWCLTSNSQHGLAGMVDNFLHAPLPYILAFVAAWLWGLYCNLSKRYAQGHNAVAVFFTIIALILWTRFLASGAVLLIPNWVGFAELTFIGVIFGVSYSFWETGIQQGSLLLLAVISYFTPVFSMIFASLWLKAMPETGFWLGVALVVAGSFVCWLASRGQPDTL